MDPSRFDSITRQLGRTLDRRTLSKSALAAVATALPGLPRATAQTPCTHKLDCAANEICSGQSSGACSACDPAYTACPSVLGDECVAPFNSRELCPFWMCVDLTSDPLNCGSCSTSCASGVCSNGQCGEAISNATTTNASGSISLVLADRDGASSPYEVSIDWSPVLVNLPNGDAWGFFTAQQYGSTAYGDYHVLSDRKVFAAQFDAALDAWQPGNAMYGNVTFGATSVVDPQGRAHLMYSVRESLAASAMSTLVYLALDESGVWSSPQTVDLNPNAGHQLSADLAIDGAGRLYAAWQDQRSVSELARNVDPSNADVFVSDLGADGIWSAPVQINVRSSETENASRPLLVVDGERLIAVWSKYDTTVGLDTATALMWSWRLLADPLGWSAPQQIFDRGSDSIGGRFLDLVANPLGGAGLVYGRNVGSENALYLQQLESGSDVWSQPVLLTTGDRGSYPKIDYAPDGTLYVVYNLGSGITVDVGAFSVGPGLSYFGLESNLTLSEDGIQGIASVAVDTTSRPWVIYFHQPQNGPVTEARVLAAAPI